MNDVSQFNEMTLAAQELASHLQQFIVPVFRRDSADHAEQFGTGFFVSKNSDTFFVSAAHVLDELRNSNQTLCVYSETGQFRNLGGTGLSTQLPASGKRSDDHLDVAVLRMFGEGLPPYPSLGKIPLPFDMLSQGPPVRADASYLLVGFPASKAKTNRSDRTHTSAYWPITSTSIPSVEYQRQGLVLASHIAMPWKKRELRGAGMKRVSSIGFPGMSGSPLFRVLGEGDEESEKGVEVVGVFIEYRKSASVLVATSTSIVVDMIAKLSDMP